MKRYIISLCLLVLFSTLSSCFYNSKDIIRLVSDDSYFSDFEVIDDLVYIKCYLTIENRGKADLSFTISADFNVDVGQLLSEKTIYAMDNQGERQIFFLSAETTEKWILCTFIGAYGGTSQKADRNLPSNITFHNQDPTPDNDANALNAYSKFLNGESIFYTNDGRQISIYDESWLFCEYAFRDMNNDGISELLIRTNIATYILTYLNGELSLWWTDEFWSGWSEILNNGDILHIRLGAAPAHISYHYVVLGNDGEELEHIRFEKYASNEEKGEYDDFYFEDKELLTQEEWDKLTSQYLNVKYIEWEEISYDDAAG